ncbi:histone-lysine N-methyltransferase 2C-like [Rhopilema esculentum]|uniref:histone-lysine N-methyltransferase 2C-like n=1 Tax=Rhopilema esculentum TaxID=499914 RepID=UPI0031DBDF8B
MSGNDHRTPNERVSVVTDILGVNKPQTMEIVDEKPGNRAETAGESLHRMPSATSIGNENDVHFSCLDNGKFKDNEGNKAPFCKHCDISIQGSGYIQCKDSDTLGKDSACVSVDDAKFVKVNVASGDDLSFVFCSQMCLKSYYSLKSRMTSGPGEGLYNDDSGQFIDPVRSVIPVSTGEASNSGYHGSVISTIDVRGEIEAAAPASVLVKRKGLIAEEQLDRKKPRLVIWKRWKILFDSKTMRNDVSKLTAAELLEKYGGALKAGADAKDERECMLCGDVGDGVTEGTARLINYDVNIWVHLNCALWSLEVYETLNGALHNVQKAYERGVQTSCVYCSKRGATVTCARVIGSQMRRCEMNYHFNCAIKANCVFFKDKTVLCPQHKNYGSVDQRLPSYAVLRKVYVNRDITKQLARVLKLNNEKEQSAFTIRIGSLIFHELGQLLPHQLHKFHSKDAIYPVGFKTTRFYWSTEQIGKRCWYVNSIEEVDGSPHFVIIVKDSGKKVGEFAGSTPKEVWSCVFEPVRKLREEAKMVKIFPEFVTGEDLFGLSDPSIQRIIESLPGVDTIHDFSFRFGRTPMIMAELPLAVNPTGCIRSESTRNVHLNRPVSLRTASSTPADRVERCDLLIDEGSQGSLLRNSWAISKTAQYRRMKSEWKNYVLLSKSRIQGLGLFAIRDIEPNTMIIEYIGSIIRNEVANKRERIYENSNRGVYMFRVDSDTVIDATLTGGHARYINHSCDPNCVAEVVIIEKMPKIIIISNRKLEKGEELTYDYKFEFEDDQHKIACLCGAANCRKWMN